MAGSITVSSITLDSDNNFSIRSNTGATILSANGTGLITGIANGASIVSAQLTTPTVSGNLNLDSTGTSGIRLPAANTLAFHTAGSEDMRIDSSGNLFLGKTSDSDAAQGLSLYPAGSISYNDNNSGTRTPISFRRSGTQVGSITTTTTGVTLTGTNGITFTASQTASADANTLDDYEEGTWTPVNASIAAITLSVTGAPRYVKIGRQVFVTCYVSYPSTGDTNPAKIGGFPFAPASGEVYSYLVGRTQYSGAGQVSWQLGSGSTEAGCHGNGGATPINNNNLSGAYVLFSGSYLTEN